MKKDNLIFITHILDSIKNIEDFLGGISKDSFLQNKEKQSAVVRQLEIIGEAVKNLPQEFKSKRQDIPWRDIAGMRDKLMHQYFGIDLNAVWKTVKEDLPELKSRIFKIRRG